MIKENLQYVWYCYLHPTVIKSWVVGKYYELLGPQFRTVRQLADARMHGNVLDACDRQRATVQANCNHRKGGIVPLTGTSAQIAKGLYSGSGSQYSVMKHLHINGDLWIECLRCGKKWKPPIRSDFSTEREFYRAIEEYEAAKKFETNNIQSTSVQCQFRLDGSLDAGHEYYRKLVANS